MDRAAIYYNQELLENKKPIKNAGHGAKHAQHMRTDKVYLQHFMDQIVSTRGQM